MHRIRTRRRLLAATLISALAASTPAAAQTALGDVFVTATRSSQVMESPPGTVTAVNRDEMDRRLPNDIADLFSDEPDISITGNTVRFGTGAINIRGIEDNRVLLLIDGVRASDLRDAGTTNYTASGRDLPEADFLKRVEIVRGPGSSLYGSDAIGGVVGFMTLDPEDFLKDGKTLARGAKASYFGENRGIKGTAWFAAGDAAMKSLVMVSRIDAKETETMGERNSYGHTRSVANPQDSSASSLLAKLAFAPVPGHDIRFTFEAKEKQTNTDVQRVGNYSPKSPNSLTRITTNLGDDSLQRQRLSLDYIHLPTASWYDRLSVKAYWQRQKTDNINYQRRSDASLNATWGCSASTAGAGNCDVNQRFEFEQTVEGASAVMEKALAGSLPQFMIWGADFLRTTTREQKNTIWTNLATGVTSNKFIGETYPLSEYPEGHADLFGLFGQDEIQLLSGRLRVTPGLRYDQFELKPNMGDPLYHPSAGRTAVAKSGSRISPKIMAAYEIAPQWSGYANYVEGFRAPTYEQVNRYFSNNQALYAVVGNPDLHPETSKGIEFGFKIGGRDIGGQIGLFVNRYKNFIDTVALATTDPAYVAGMTNGTSQYKNLSNVKIHGHELRGHWQASRELKLSAAYAYSWGAYESTPGIERPLNSIEPRRLVLSALWTPSSEWGVEARLRAAAKKDRTDDASTISSTNFPIFHPGAYAVADLSAWLQLSRDTRLNAAVNNLFDRKYWLWSTVRGMNTDDLGPEFYSQPGRNISVSLRTDF